MPNNSSPYGSHAKQHKFGAKGSLLLAGKRHRENYGSKMRYGIPVVFGADGMRFHESRGKEPRDVPDHVHEVLR